MDLHLSVIFVLFDKYEVSQEMLCRHQVVLENDSRERARERERERERESQTNTKKAK